MKRRGVLLGVMLVGVAALGPGAAHAAAACQPAGDISVVIDDSPSMGGNDPGGLRGQALRLLLSKPANQAARIGGIQFGGSASTLFRPGIVGDDRGRMISSLRKLRNDGSGSTDPGGTNYNAAFKASRRAQPGADARIFLTDGVHNVGTFMFSSVGSAPVYVIGLNIGPDRRNDADAHRLGQIAARTGGKYFPLKLHPRDGTLAQLQRLQPAVNRISGALACRDVTKQVTQTIDHPGAGHPVTTTFGPHGSIEIVATWVGSATDVGIGPCVVRNRGGKVIADLRGRGHRKKLKVYRRKGATYRLLGVHRPKGGRTLTCSIQGIHIPKPTPVTIQIQPGGSGGSYVGSRATNLTAVSLAPNSVALTADISWKKGLGPVTCILFQDGAQIAADPCTGKYGKGLFFVVSGGHSYQVVPVDKRGTAGRASNVATVQVASALAIPYDNYGTDLVGRPMCRGNPGVPSSNPGGTASETFTVPAFVGSISAAKVNIDPSTAVTAHATLLVNGTARAGDDKNPTGGTIFNFGSVPVASGDSVTLSINFTSTAGSIITVYTAGNPGGSFTASNPCSASSGTNFTTSTTGMRAQVYGLTP